MNNNNNNINNINSKVKRILFTHTDLDGVGCAILFDLWCMAEGVTDYDSLFCVHHNILGKVSTKIEGLSKNGAGLYFTDIAPEHGALKSLIEDYNVMVFDHHEFNLPIKDFMSPNKCFVETHINGIMTSGTQMFYRHVRETIASLPDININDVDMFVEHVTAYDTFRWVQDEEEMTPLMLNEFLYLIGINAFKSDMISKMKEGKPFLSEDERRILTMKINNSRVFMHNMEAKVKVKEIGGYNVALSISEKINMSEFMYRYMSSHPEVDIMISVNMNTGGLLLKTQRDDINMNIIAQNFGGGGHKQVAGGVLKDFAIKTWEMAENQISSTLSSM